MPGHLRAARGSRRLEQVAATLRSSRAAELASIDSEDLVDGLGDLMTALANDPADADGRKASDTQHQLS